MDPSYYSMPLPETSEQKDIALLGTFLGAKADMKARDNENWTVLHHAVSEKRSETVKYLLSRTFLNGWFVSEVQ